MNNKLNDKFKKVLDQDELKDAEFVKQYLEFSFYKRKPQKDNKLYINICKIYEVYPDTIKELVDNIPTLGYNKDYFHILKHVNYRSEKQNELAIYIDDILVKQIKEDIVNMNKKSSISTLGKFLPREGAKLNKKTNFIDRFNSMMWPNVSQTTARRNYRKLKTQINAYLGTLETKLCKKDYDNINFNKVSHYALTNNMNVIQNHEAAQNKYKEHLLDKLKTGSLKYFVNCTLSKDGVYTPEEVQNIWDYNRFVMDIPGLSYEILANSAIVIDLSKDTFSYKFEYFTIGLALLVQEFSMLNKRVFIAGHGYIDFSGCNNVVEKAEYLMKLCGPCRNVLLTDYLKVVEEIQCKNIIFVTGKNIGNIEEVLVDKKITLRQYLPEHDKYYIILYDGNKIKKYCRYNHKDFSNEEDDEKVRDICQITSHSSELNSNNTPAYWIVGVFAIWYLLQSRLLF